MTHPRLYVRPLVATGALALALIMGAIAVAVVGDGATSRAGATDPTFVTAGPCDPVPTCSGSNAGGAIGILPGQTGTISLGEGLFSVSYACPAVLTSTSKGTVRFKNTTADVMNVFNGRRQYVRLAAGASTNPLLTKPSGDFIVWTIQHPTLGIATVTAAMVNRISANDCHLQIQAVITRP
jgi:hypothetical protein